MNLHVHNLMKLTNEGAFMKTIKKWWLVIAVGLFGVLATLNAQAGDPAQKFELQLKGQPVGITCYKPAGCWRIGLRVMTRNPDIDMLPGDLEVMQAVGFDVVKEGEIKPQKPPFEPKYSVTTKPEGNGKIAVSMQIEHETWSESLKYRCAPDTGECEETIRGGGG